MINSRRWRHELGIGIAGNETGVVNALVRESFDYLSVGVDAVEGRLFGEEEGVRLQIMV